MTEDQVKASGQSYKVGRFPFSANSRAKLQHEGEGFVKVISNRRLPHFRRAYDWPAGKRVHR
jgi:pyruvate/2-oxoglutarate dehydrogenase complex dihydrolipoamide dehydrogenase (E3) component